MPRNVAAFGAVIVSLVSAGCGGSAAQPGKRVIVLGIDGMDPGFLERHWNALPELNRLRNEGGFLPLRTTMPPQSPVAWSTFITGSPPSEHGIFDFVHRDPVALSPVSSMSQTAAGTKELRIGSYILPLRQGEVRTLRRGTPFWKLLADHGVNTRILRMPTDFPPIECDAHALSGMGTPDLRGTFGTFAFFTTDGKWRDRKFNGGEAVIVKVENGHTVLRVPGPDNSLRKGNPRAFAEMDVFVDPTEAVARFQLGDRSVILKQGEWSEWIMADFELLPLLAHARGMFRIFVKQLHPEFAVYVSPVNIDPSAPSLPISQPESFSAQLAQKIGPFYTQGMPYDTAALRYGIFDRQEYRAHSRQVSDQTLRLLRTELDRFESGLLFFHFFGVDQDSHMLWGSFEDELLETYKLVDQTIAWVRDKAPDSLLIVMSDHGFTRFARAVHLNSWLRGQGLLTLATERANPGLADVDWSRTKAYAVGLNAIYVNQQFRERDGIVAEGEETRLLLRDLRERLLAFRDPENGREVITAVQEAFRASADPLWERAPDLIVGYGSEYRGSWQTALGEIPGALVEDNADEWRGDHCIDPSLVPGVLLSNRRITMAGPGIEDLTVTILSEFGVGAPSSMKGRTIYSGGQ